MAGLATDCPHCGQQTELLLAPPPEEPTVPHRTIAWAIVGIAILTLGLIGAVVALKRAERWAARQKQHAQAQAEAAKEASAQTTAPAPMENQPTQNGFGVSGVRLEKTPGTSLLYALGTIKNQTDHKRFGIKVELDLLDAGDQKIATATDYRQVMEPGAGWEFKALVVDPKAASAKVVAIREDQ